MTYKTKKYNMLSQKIKTMRKHDCSSCGNFIVGIVERIYHMKSDYYIR